MTISPEDRSEDLRNLNWDGQIAEARARRDMGEFNDELRHAQERIMLIDKELGENTDMLPGKAPIVAPRPPVVHQWLDDLTSAMVVTLGVDEDAHKKAVELYKEIEGHFQ